MAHYKAHFMQFSKDEIIQRPPNEPLTTLMAHYKLHFMQFSKDGFIQIPRYTDV